jgi:hypothetical protein
MDTRDMHIALKAQVAVIVLSQLTLVAIIHLSGVNEATEQAYPHSL